MKPTIKKRITRAIASVINWFTVGSLKAAINRSPKILIQRQKKKRSRQILCRWTAFETLKRFYFYFSSLPPFCQQLFFLTLLWSVTVIPAGPGLDRNVLFIRSMVGLFMFFAAMLLFWVLRTEYDTTPLADFMTNQIIHCYTPFLIKSKVPAQT